MNTQIIFSVFAVVFMAVLIVMMWTIYSGMKKFLRENIQEVLIVAGDCIGESITSLDNTMTKKMNVLQNENAALRTEITQRLDAISSIIAEANDKSELGVNSIVKELNYIIPALRDEIKSLLSTLSENAAAFQESTIKNFEEKINEFTETINKMCGEIKKSADEQSKTFAGMAGSVHSVMDKGEKDLQSAFTKTHSELRGIITDSMKQIDSDYQENMKKMFQAMADNLASIIKQLRPAGTDAELPAKTESNPPAENTPEQKPKKPRGRQKTQTLAENPKKIKKNDTAKEDSNDAA